MATLSESRGPYRSALLPEPLLTPSTAKQLIATYSQPAAGDLSPSDQSSPDSTYSDHSPTLPQHQTFEFDDDFEERDVGEHDAELESDEEEGGYRVPTWGNWPEVGAANYRTWASRSATSLQGTILSVSPRGSISGDRRKSSVGSIASTKLRKSSLSRSLLDPRRESDPDRMGSFSVQSRRSSTKSYISANDRRRSSGISLDPSEAGRLRHIASMNLLSRRFSEAIEVSSPISIASDHPSMARRAFNDWSPYSISSLGDDDDLSEVHTAPFEPTPPAPRPLPGMLSNFPLSSVAVDPLDPVSQDSSPSPSFAPPGTTVRTSRLPLPPALPTVAVLLATPPAPVEPAELLRKRSRPSLKRALTDYQFPARTTGRVPSGVGAPRGSLQRSTSTPFFAAAKAAAVLPSVQPSPSSFEPKGQATGAFPLQRAVALGTSPLRESLRKGSTTSEPATRRESEQVSLRTALATPRRSSASTRASVSTKDQLRRFSFDRRMSMDGRSLDGRTSISALRRESENYIRKQSDQQRARLSTDVRRMSIESGKEGIRNQTSSFAMRRSATSDSRISTTSSRKSSTVSVGEYGYLGSHIQVDGFKISTPMVEPAAIPRITPEPIKEQLPPPASGTDTPRPKRRLPRPPSIVLPAYSFPTLSPVPGSAALITPRYSPLDSFFGRAPLEYVNTDIDPLMPVAPLIDASNPAESAQTASVAGVLNRPRPISPPEFDDDEGILSRWRSKTSPKAANVGHHTPSAVLSSETFGKAVLESPLPVATPVAQDPRPEDARELSVSAPPTQPEEDRPLRMSEVVEMGEMLKQVVSLPIIAVAPIQPEVPVVAAREVEKPKKVTTPPVTYARLQPALRINRPKHEEPVEEAAVDSLPPALNELTPRSAARRKAVPELSEAQLVKENSIERELRSKSSLDQLRLAHRATVEKSGSTESSRPRMHRTTTSGTIVPTAGNVTSPRSKRRSHQIDSGLRVPMSPRQPSTASTTQARPSNRRNVTMPHIVQVRSPTIQYAAGQVTAGVGGGNPYAAHAMPRRSHVVFELPTWRSPVLADSSPEILASATIDGSSFIIPQPNSPNMSSSSSARQQSHGARPGHYRAPSAASIQTARPSGAPLYQAIQHHSVVPPQVSARPAVGRATSFTRFFHRSKGSAKASASEARGVESSRPISLDEAAFARIGLSRR